MVKRCHSVGIILLSLCSAVYALDPLGPPKATTGPGNWSFGIEYAYSETDIELSNVVQNGSAQPDTSGKALEGNRGYVTIRHGLFENLDIFARVGVSKFESQILAHAYHFVGDTDLAWGIGAALTICDRNPLSWGVVAQWSHGESQHDRIDSTHHIRSKMEIDSFQIAAGPTLQVRDDMSLYGGGFYHALDGEHDYGPTTFDFEEDSCLGAFAGLRWEIKENAFWNCEIQHTGTAIALGTGLQWLFK